MMKLINIIEPWHIEAIEFAFMNCICYHILVTTLQKVIKKGGGYNELNGLHNINFKFRIHKY